MTVTIHYHQYQVVGLLTSVYQLWRGPYRVVTIIDNILRKFGLPQAIQYFCIILLLATHFFFRNTTDKMSQTVEEWSAIITIKIAFDFYKNRKQGRCGKGVPHMDAES